MIQSLAFSRVMNLEDIVSRFGESECGLEVFVTV
jgi:hypothetical protein